MGITVSHTNYAPISLVSALIGFVSFAFTLGTFFKVFWSNLGTFGAAPREIDDVLSNLKHGLLEERRHLRRVKRRQKSVKRDRSHGPGARSDSEDEYTTGGYARHPSKRRGRDGRRSKNGKKPRMHFDRDIQSMRSTGEEEALRVMRNTIRDLIKKFRQIEQPFLKPEYQQQDAAQWSTNSNTYAVSPSRAEKHPSSNHYPHSEDDSHNVAHMQASNRLGHEYRNCGYRERWLWVRRKADAIDLMDSLNRVEIRRMAHEVGSVFNMVCDIGRDLDDFRASLDSVEGRLNRVVGIRRVD